MIKKLLLLLVAALCSLSTTSVAQTWNLVWEDNFNGTGLPDPAKWGYDVGNGGWGNGELQNYTANRTENARQENGNLVLEARRDWYNGIEYSSARLVSKNKGDWKYGKIEVRAKIPLGQGLWPAIWMLPTDWVYGGWPASGEIDIMENFALGGIKPNSIEGNVHTQAYHHSIGTNKGAKKEGLSNVQDNFHVYAVSWYANKIDFMVDGQVYFTFNNEGTWQTWPFDQRFHMILNIAVGGALGTTPDPNIFPKQMLVDYVKVYQEGSPGPNATTGLITAYHEGNYNGFSGGLGVGDYKLSDLQALGLANDQISSLKITEGYRAILFQDDNFSGGSTVINSDNSGLNGTWNNKTSSIRVETNGELGLAGSYYLQNRKTGFYMDIAGGPSATGNSTNVFQWDLTLNSNQRFNISHLDNGTYKVLAAHSGKTIDVAGIGTTDGTNVQQWDYLGSDNQKFILYPTGDGYFKLIAKHSGKFIEVDGSGSGAGTNVQQWTNANQQNGHWKLIPASSTGLVTFYENCNYSGISRGFGEGEYTTADMKSALLPDNFFSALTMPKGFVVELFLDDNFQGASYKVYESDNCFDNNGFSNNVSSFKIYPRGVLGLSGEYSFENRVSGQYIDLEGNGNTADGSNYLQWPGTGGENQQFILTELQDGVYGIVCKKTSKSWDIAGGSTADKGNLIQYGTSHANMKHRQFIVIDAGNGFIQLVARHSGKVIEVEGASKTNGANVQQYKNNNQECSHWNMKPVVVTDVIDIADDEVYVYPNPVHDVINLIGIPSSTRVDIFSIDGLLISTSIGNKVDVQNLASGSYVIKIYTENRVKTERIIKY